MITNGHIVSPTPALPYTLNAMPIACMTCAPAGIVLYDGTRVPYGNSIYQQDPHEDFRSHSPGIIASSSPAFKSIHTASAFVRKNLSRKKGGRRKVTDEQITAALVEHKTQTAAAKALGVNRMTISRRIANATFDSALAVFKGTFTKGRGRIVSDEEIAAALREHKTQKTAAKVLGINQSAISQRIADAAVDSALAVFKGTFNQKRVSDEQIAAAIEEHKTQTAAAEALGVGKMTISRRIANAAVDSALYAFKGTFKAAPPQKVTDEQIAAALREHTSRTAAAEALGIHQKTISRRIADATVDSALYAFKNIFRRKKK